MRYQLADGPDVDIIYHVRDYSEDQSPDTLTYLGLGDLDLLGLEMISDSILQVWEYRDGGAVVAYHDSTDPDPLFAVEMELPY